MTLWATRASCTGMQRPSGFDKGSGRSPDPGVGGARDRGARKFDLARGRNLFRQRAESDEQETAPGVAEELAAETSPVAEVASVEEKKLAPEPEQAPVPEPEPEDYGATVPSAVESPGEVDEADSVRTTGLARLRGQRSADPVRDAERRVKEASRRLKRRERHERRRFSAMSRKRRRTWLIAGAAVLALALFVLVGVFTPVMAVRNVEVAGATAMNPADVQQALSRFEGTPLALVKEEEVEAALEPFPLIQRYALERIPPDTLRVRIIERVPVIALEQDGAYKFYDAAGVLVGAGDAPAEGVPVAQGRVANLDSEAFASAARVLRDMPWDLRAQVTSVSAGSGEDVSFDLASGIEVMWGGSDLTARKSVVLSSMLASLAPHPVTFIDVSSTEAPVFR